MDINNNLEDLRNKLKHTAKHHARRLASHTDETNSNSEGEFSIKDIAELVISLDFFEAFDRSCVAGRITELNKLLNELLGISTLTQSMYSKEQMPVAFDALVEIFTFSNEEFRQKYFEQLRTFYYEELCKNLRNLESEQVLDIVDYDLQVKVLLPLVKLRLVKQWSQNNTSSSKTYEAQLLSNIALYFKFPVINQEDVYEVIRNKIGSSDFDLQSYELIQLDEKNGHLGEYFKLKIKVNVARTLQQFDLFAKALTTKTEITRKVVLSGPSKKEEFFYMTYIPLLEEYGINFLNFAPRCYFSRQNDILILDDMAASGFVGLTPNTLLKFDALHKVVQKMASFHSSTMILEEILSQKAGKRVTLYDLYAEFLQEAFLISDDDYFLKPYFDVGLKTMYYLATKFPELTEKFSEKFLKEKINNGWQLVYKKLEKSDNLKNTICHGDMYVSNMLFKYDTEHICQDVRLIDFQILRYCPPAHDFLFFLYQSCTKEERDKYLPQLCDEYYTELSKNIANFGFDINEVYPKEDFENSLSYMKSQALFQALYYCPITAISPKLREEVLSSDEQIDYYIQQHRWKLVDIGFEDINYKTLMKGLIKDLADFCENGDI